jgi:diacylglycerol O-acyltransferase
VDQQRFRRRGPGLGGCTPASPAPAVQACAPPVYTKSRKSWRVLKVAQVLPFVRLWAAFDQRRILKTMFERVSADDLMSLASRRHPPPLQVGAVLILEAPGELAVGGLRTVLQQRIAAVPRLRQRLQRVPLGCGRPIWVDDAGFTIDDHVTVVTPHSEADDAGLLDIAADLVAKPLPEDRPLWSATLVPGMTGGRAGLVLVMHHVVGDGLAGLAVLRGLVDGSATSAAAAVPQPRPTRAALAKDAWREHIRSLQRLPKGLGRLFAAFDELRPSLAGRAQRCSLNKPTGPRRSIRTVVVDLHQVRELAHRNGATVNDLVLTAVTGALHQLLIDRGERLDTLVVSVPFAARTRTEPGQLGNRSGVIPVNLPTSGGFSDRLTAVSAIMRAAKQYERGFHSCLGTRLPAAGPARHVPILHSSPAIRAHLRERPSRSRRTAQRAGLPGAGGDTAERGDGQRHRLLYRPFLRQASSDHDDLRPGDLSRC